MTSRFSNSDLIELARDVKSAPLRKCEEASCFKWYCGPNPNNPTEIVEGWTPCSLHDQEKYKMSMMDIIDRGEKMVPPAISLVRTTNYTPTQYVISVIKMKLLFVF